MFSPKNRTVFNVAAGVVAVAAAGLLADSITSIDTNEVACFRTFGNTDCGDKVPVLNPDGKQVVTNGKPIEVYSYYGKGLHMVWPLVTSVDRLKISQRLTEPQKLQVTLGQQNQPADLTYQTMVSIPRQGMMGPDGAYVDSVYNLLYGVGNAGSADVNGTVDRVINAALNKAFAPIEPDNISAQRNQILKTTSDDVAGSLARIGVKMDAPIMVSQFELQGAWKQAANLRVLSIGKKEAAQNEAEAEKLKGQGKGESEQAEATGHAAAISAKAEADAAYIKKMREAFGNDANALAIFMLTQSKTALPQVMGSNGIQVVVPAAKP